MTYIDSDGVLADLDSYFFSKLGHYPKVEEAWKIMVDNYKECFLVSKQMPHSAWFFDMLKNDPNCYVLTALSRKESLEPFCSNIDVDTILNTHRENKYKWYEQRGVSRDKVIVVDHASEKLDYCKPGDILYDDRKKTIEEWKGRGGIGVHIYNPHWKESV